MLMLPPPPLNSHTKMIAQSHGLILAEIKKKRLQPLWLKNQIIFKKKRKRMFRSLSPFFNILSLAWQEVWPTELKVVFSKKSYRIFFQIVSF